MIRMHGVSVFSLKLTVIEMILILVCISGTAGRKGAEYSKCGEAGCYYGGDGPAQHMLGKLILTGPVGLLVIEHIDELRNTSSVLYTRNYGYNRYDLENQMNEIEVASRYYIIRAILASESLSVYELGQNILLLIQIPPKDS